jgi:hypothetical protein
MRLSTEIQPRIADINYLKESAYDYTKWNLGDSITFNDGMSDIDRQYGRISLVKKYRTCGPQRMWLLHQTQGVSCFGK